MVAFPETEPMTIKRIEVALRNKDLYLLQEATNKLHEKYHTGFEFTMFDELSHIKEYVESTDIPNEIKDVLCPTLDGILSSVGKEVTKYQIDEEKEKQREELKRNYDYNFEAPTSSIIQNNEENIENEPQNVEVNEENYNQPSNEDNTNFEENTNQEENINQEENQTFENQEMAQQSFDFSYSNQENEQNNYENQNYNEEQHDFQNQNFEEENVEFQAQEEVQQPYENNPEINEENVENEPQNVEINEENKELEDVAIFYNMPSTKDVNYEINDYRQKLNFINSNLYARQPVNVLGKVSSIMDMVDVRDNICDFLYGISKTKCNKTFITTSLNQNITNYLANNNVKFQIPMVQNTYSEESNLDIIPLFGLTNLFVCPKCGSMFLNTGSYLKILSLACPECDSVSYPNIKNSNGYECNPIFWHRAFSALAKSKTWVIINPPKIDENEAIIDFLRVAFKASGVKKIYIYSKDKDNTYENIINQYNKDTQISSSYDSLEALYNDLLNNKGIE